MRTAFSASGLLAALLLVTVTGCSPKLDDKRTVDIGPGESKFSFVDPIRSEQKITVTAKGPEEFDIYLFLEKNKKTIEEEADKGEVKSALAKAVKTKDAKLSASIPAGEGAATMIRSNKKSKIDLHTTNR